MAVKLNRMRDQGVKSQLREAQEDNKELLSKFLSISHKNFTHQYLQNAIFL